jgi:hypothetical protein
MIVTILTGVLLGAGAAPALAEDVPPSPAFGRHIASVTPEHPLEHGSMFGTCVGTMAVTGACPGM